MTVLTLPRSRSVFANAGCDVEPTDDGGFIARCALPEAPYPDGVIEVLRQQAAEDPGRVLFRESALEGIVAELTVGDAYALACRVGRTLRDLGASAERPVMLLADNSLRAAVVILACYAARVPVAPVSPSYSRMSSDFAKLRHVVEVLTPSVVVLDDGALHTAALAAAPWGAARLVALERPPSGALAWGDLLGLAPTAEEAAERSDPDVVAKILFTSGSTGMPKGVINTQRMMMSNQQALAQVWSGVFDRPPRLVDWLPWNHTYGGNQQFNMPIVFGGSLTIDRGRPTPAGFATMVASIKRTRPTIFLSVPRALDLLADELLQDRALAQALFEDLDLIGYAGAALPPPVSARLKEAAMRTVGRDVPVVGLWGATETAPVATAVYFASSEPANIGLPIPGFALKFTPDGAKHELRVKGPGVTPGYWRQPEATQKAFDADGFYRMGDAGRLVEPGNIDAGIVFDGRVAENFKLLSGTWVNVGALRVKVIAACVDDIADVVVTGHDRDDIGVLIFPKAMSMGAGHATAQDGCLIDAAQAARIRAALAAYNRTAGGSSNRIARALVLAAPPSIDGGEITDKGYLNQRAVLEGRAALVQRLYADPPMDGVIVIEKGAARA
ncbi:AMP-binding protein [Bradyrhizobium sp. U87765 SZCCT0131]|uniref:AMP-binding protein n=1 Tax=unclassified Bradyrhizobium TaxID=2631580 RepID=UPI001BAAD32D|nr:MULTISPECIES: AMP-binding protein [unclassified Bradyrhizobium]MBR1223037.1 AMP-binding protein [Bradyrhizobium sp. U87765 SZCCT0131]MBR1262773.1 AMP-binding protein [Bradyrhizobium sp. U87765 SZCCT0134]MBR1308755.1 AMP-binding protein [Bradyrhizobium sp. U87765 SZCCT0110]MBR1318555.1 AMP-binding protein [Bradyrhizobium sp. U87765 SZCCT0109]MBR1352259.1 AMP-binding protein [Bradyrhizobium sp. U87765 SZCCT0048]